MLKNKKMMLFLLAANSILSANTYSENLSDVKYEKLYNNMVKNIQTGKSNESNNKLIESILKKRNKELKDLYKQSDYIVKPEYLEWQIFASGFYAERDRGDNSSSNGKYSSDVQGYYDSNGDYIVTSGKPYRAEQEVKEVELGLSIPVKGISVGNISLNPGGVTIPDNFQVSANITVPTVPAVAGLTLSSFTPSTPSVSAPSVFTPPLLSKVATGFGQGALVGINAEYSSMVGNASVYANASGTTITTLNQGWNSSNSFDWNGKNDWMTNSGTYAGGTSGGTDYKYTFVNALANSYDVVGNWTFINGTTGYTTTPIGNTVGAARFISVNHAFASKDKTITMNLDGNLTLKGRSDGLEITVGIEHQAFDALHAEAKNNGIMTLESGKYLIGMNAIVERNYYNSCLYNNSGNTALDTACGVGRTPELLSIKSTMENNGKIVIKSEESIGIDFGAYQQYNEPMAIAVYSGNIEVDGTHNYALRVPDVFQTNPDYFSETIINGVTKDTTNSLSQFIASHQGEILVKGTENVGISLSKKITGSTQVAAINGISASDSSDLIGNIRNISIKVDGDKGIGILRNSDYNSTMTGDIILTNTHISGNANEGLIFGSNATNSILIRSDRYSMVLGRNLTIENGNINNVVMLSNGIDSNNVKSAVINNTGVTLTLENTTSKIAGLMSVSGATLENNGTIVLNSTDSQGLVITNIKSASNIDSSGANTGIITVNGEGSTGVYNAGEFNMSAGEVAANGVNSVAIYGEAGNNKTNLNGGIIKASNSGIGLYSGDNATININGASLEVSDKGLLMYTYKNSTATATSGHVNVTGTVNADIKAGGTAFYLKGDQSQITNFINSIFTGSGILNLNMLDSDSRLFILDSPVNDIYLSSSSSSAIESLIPSSKVTVTGTGYKPYSVFKGNLIVDQNVNLDDINDPFNRLDFLSSRTEIKNGVEISGTDNNISVIGQKNYDGTSSRDEIKIINNGIIKHTGQSVIGIVTDFGSIENNNTISLLGDSSIGIYGANETLIKNAGKVEIGSNGIGIYGTNLLTTLAPTYGTQKIEIENTGEVKTAGTTGGIGIYSNNSNTAVAPADAKVTLGNTSKIDIISSVNGVGIYGKRTAISGGGSISVGEDGIGMHLDESNVNLSNITINLVGDNSLGFNLKNGTTFSGTGVFNVSGNNTVLFNLMSALPSTEYINYSGFTAGGSGNYIGGNVENAGFYHNSIDTISDKSTVAIGKNSVIMFDNTTNITAAGNNNIIGMADGVYNGGMPFTYTGLGVTATKELTNKGIISINNNSAALYGKNNAGILNSGVISTGKNSVAVYANLTNDVLNSGTINLGENSKGIFSKDGVFTSDINTGKILSSSNFATGIYSEYNGGSGTLIRNSGDIILSGLNLIGIYTTGTGIQSIENTGIISISNSNDINDPSMGIYSVNSANTISNSGKINVGNKSLGIFNKSGSIIQKGELFIGDGGIGIFSDGGNVQIDILSDIRLGTGGSVGVYGRNNAIVNNDQADILIGDGSYGFILESGSELTNNAVQTLGSNSILAYGTGSIKNISGATINVKGSDNIVFYSVNGGSVDNNGDIVAGNGKSNIGIYNSKGIVNNTGNIEVGNSVVLYDFNGIIDITKSKYSVGIYGEESDVTNSGNIVIGENAVGLYVKNNTTVAKNSGNITTGTAGNPKNGAVGIFSEGGEGIENYGNITLYGDDVIGIAGKNAKKIENHATITVEGKNAKGIYSTLNTEVYNYGTINVSGTGGVGIIAPSGKIKNYGTIYFTNGAKMEATDNAYEIPELINAGIIRVNGNFDNTGMNISLKPDLSTLQESTIAGVDFIMNSGSISANTLTITDTVKILPDFSQGTNAKVYKLEDAFVSSNITTSNGKLPVVSSSFTWEATPKINSNGNIDVYMSKRDYKDLTEGLWYEDFASVLDKNYYGASGDAGKIYDKIDLIQSEKDFRHIMASLSGNIYANINQREEDITRSFENAMDLMETSENNTKENIKVNVIAGKGRTKEDTDGIVNYDYTTTGVLALREVERTYKHTFGYSLGYLHTGFEFKDGNESDEWVETVQLGLHNKYSLNDWKLRNDLTGRVSFHNVDRNINWPSPTEKSEMNGTYETYSITSDNIFGKEIALGKSSSLTPYGGLRLMYVTRPDFNEDGLEAVKVEGNDAWSVKPRVGIEVETKVPLGNKSAWQLKGALDIAYEYELANLNEREYAKLTAMDSDYYKLSEPEEEKGTFRTKAAVGIEAKDRYGIFLTGEYGIGNNNQDDYRAGLTMKAVF